MKKINLGCGDKYNDRWINLDFNSNNPAVTCHNLLTPLPFSDHEIDVIYNSHFLEHFSLVDAKNILTECYRVLKNGGTIRIVVPDLENVCREYLYVLDNIEQQKNSKKYEWIIIELLDQFVRNNPGGLMNEYRENILKSDNQFMIDYIYKRTGINLIENKNILKKTLSEKIKQINMTQVKSKLIYFYVSLIKQLLPASYRKCIMDNTVLGEKHKWMYDRHSLHLILEEVGFSEIQFLDFQTSSITNFSDDYLDMNLDGSPYRKSSIYCEAFK